MASGIYVNKDLYLRNTDELISNVLGGLSLTSTFAINIKDTNSKANEISFLAYEATLPGTSFQTAEVSGDVQGLSQSYAIKKIFPPIDISFYIKADYGTIIYFEEWMNKISPLQGGQTLNNSFYKFNYPNTYKYADINIVKYERDFRAPSERLKRKGAIKDPRSITYSLLKAYPVNIIAIPVSYEASSILRTTITFNYDRYIFQTHAEKNSKLYPSATKVANIQQPTNPPVVPIKVVRQFPNESDEEYYNRTYGES